MTRLEKLRVVTGVLFGLSVLTFLISFMKNGEVYWYEIIAGCPSRIYISFVELVFILSLVFSIFFGYAFYFVNTLCKDQWD